MVTDKYHLMNIRTGEIVQNFANVLKTELFDLIHYHFIGIWKYNAKGY